MFASKNFFLFSTLFILSYLFHNFVWCKHSIYSILDSWLKLCTTYLAIQVWQILLPAFVYFQLLVADRPSRCIPQPESGPLDLRRKVSPSVTADNLSKVSHNRAHLIVPHNTNAMISVSNVINSTTNISCPTSAVPQKIWSKNSLAASPFHIISDGIPNQVKLEHEHHIVRSTISVGLPLAKNVECGVPVKRASVNHIDILCKEDGCSSVNASLPLVVTNINGMFVPLSTQATIIVVSSPTVTMPSNSTQSRLLAGNLSASSILPPRAIAPAPPQTVQFSESSQSHGSRINPSVQATSTMQRKTYRCDEPFCGKTYFKNSHLKVHRRVHTGKNDTSFKTVALHMSQICIVFV